MILKLGRYRVKLGGDQFAWKFWSAEKTSDHPNHILHRYQKKVLVITLLANDVFMVGLALMLAWYLRIGGGWLSYDAPKDLAAYLRMTLAAALILPILFGFNRLYKYNFLLGGTQEYEAVVRSCTYGMVALVFVSFMEHNQPLSRGWLLMSWAFTTLMVGSSRFLWRRFFQWLRASRGWYVTPTLIVGVSEHARTIARQLSSQNSGVDIVGFVDDFLPAGANVVDGKSVLGSPGQLHELADRYGVKQMIVLPNAVSWETFREIIEQSAFSSDGFEIHLSTGYYEILTTGVQVSHKAFVPLLQLEQARITGIDKLLKTILDYGLAFALALLFLPLILLLGLAIWISDGRPVFVRHKVLGLGGDEFWTTKLRTNLWGTSFRRLGYPQPRNDPNDTAANSFRVGGFIYRFGLDKLPQLFDILRGKMSLVGPRTVSPEKAKRGNYWLLDFMTVKPGWIGPWAVGGAKNLEDEMRLNLYYIRNWTIWLDLQVLYQAAKLAFSRKSRKAV